MPTLMTPDEVAKVLGVTVHTLAAWRSNKRMQLEHVKVGHLVRYKPEHVAAFIEAQTRR